ncbi:MAG TPA: hypothetical protein VMG12_44470 [Polyangiaceae bacterium]|nr:hypothetical protein [Polyangiaceae bacterium]
MLHWPPSPSRRPPADERYELHGHGPPVRSHEVEHAGRLAIEVLILWGGDVLCASHVAAPAAVFVGDASDCDIALPAELLGAERRCVAVGSRGDVCAVLPAGAEAWLMLPDGTMRPCVDPGAPLERERSEPIERLLPLPLGYRAQLCFAQLEIQVATVRLGRACRRRPRVDTSLSASLGLSALGVASVLAALSRLAPAPGLNHDERAETARLHVLRTYLAAATERAEPPRGDAHAEAARAAAATAKAPALAAAAPEPAPSDAAIDADPIASVEPALELGAAPATERDPIERRAQLQEAREFGIVGMLDWPELNDPKYKFERHLDSEEVALMQRLFNPDQKPLDDGPGGLSLSTTGIGGGGKANVVALGAVRTTGEGEGRGLERHPEGRLDAQLHTARAPSSHQPESISSDPLAAASIRRAVHAERAALRGCYSDARGTALMAMGALVRFVVRGDGQLEQVRATEPALPESVSRCIEHVFLGLSVPNPVARPVHVSYRVALDS